MTEERIRIGPDYRIVGSPCPVCARLLTGATSVDKRPPDAPQAAPKAGDLTVCCYCGTWLAFVNAAGDLRLATDDEIRSVDPTLQRLPQAFDRRRRRRPF